MESEFRGTLIKLCLKSPDFPASGTCGSSKDISSRAPHSRYAGVMCVEGGSYESGKKFHSFTDLQNKNLKTALYPFECPALCWEIRDPVRPHPPELGLKPWGSRAPGRCSQQREVPELREQKGEGVYLGGSQ